LGRKQRTAAQNAHADAAVIRTNVDFEIEIAPADGIRLPFLGSGDFGTSPFFGSSSQGDLPDRSSTYHSWDVVPT
jgi:hypothetical protein